MALHLYSQTLQYWFWTFLFIFAPKRRKMVKKKFNNFSGGHAPKSWSKYTTNKNNKPVFEGFLTCLKHQNSSHRKCTIWIISFLFTFYTFTHWPISSMVCNHITGRSKKTKERKKKQKEKRYKIIHDWMRLIKGRKKKERKKKQQETAQ